MIASSGDRRQVVRVIRQDYLLRLIQEAAELLARLLGRQAAGDFAGAAELAGSLAERWLGLSGERLRTLDSDALLAHLQQTGGLAEFPFRLGLAISVLHAEGARLVADGCVEEARQLQATALCLLLRANLLNLTAELPAFTPGVEELLAPLRAAGALPLPAAVLLMCHYEHSGQFGRAEDVLFHLREDAGAIDGLVELGEQFYQRLLRRTDPELEAGDLPRQEAVAGLNAWRQQGGPQRAAQP